MKEQHIRSGMNVIMKLNGTYSIHVQEDLKAKVVYS